jgi:hypothetical protein
MTKQTKGILVAVTVLAVAAFVYSKFANKKMAFSKTIVKLGGASSLPVLLTFEEDFLKQWALALKKGEKMFTYKGENYNTTGGKKLKNP